jgi:hypothetical protein
MRAYVAGISEFFGIDHRFSQDSPQSAAEVAASPGDLTELQEARKRAPTALGESTGQAVPSLASL